MTTFSGPGPTSAAPSSAANHGFAEGEPVTFLPKNSRGGLRRIVASIARLADIQFSIWATEAKITLMRVALFFVLFGVAILMGLLGVIAIFIGLFHVLTDILNIPVVWAHLIMGGGWLTCAMILFLIARSMLQRSMTTPRSLRSARL